MQSCSLCLAVFLASCAPASEVPSEDSSQVVGTDAPESDTPQVTLSADLALLDWLRTENEGYTDDLRFAFADVDLNGDGEMETLVYTFGPMICGSGGCNVFVLQRDGGEYTKISGHTVSNLPIGAFYTETNGWRDLAITVRGGGLEEGPNVARLPFDGTRYPLNPTVLPAERTDEAFEIVLHDVEWQELQPMP